MLEHRLSFNTPTVCPQWIHPTHYLVYLLGVSNFLSVLLLCYFDIFGGKKIILPEDIFLNTTKYESRTKPS